VQKWKSEIEATVPFASASTATLSDLERLSAGGQRPAEVSRPVRWRGDWRLAKTAGRS
jgi:hypothetical protein